MDRLSINVSLFGLMCVLKKRERERERERETERQRQRERGDESRVFSNHSYLKYALSIIY